MNFVVTCVVAADGVAVAPCGMVDGVAYAPLLVAQSAALDYTQSPALFGWALSIVLLSFVVGNTVGAIIRVIRST